MNEALCWPGVTKLMSGWAGSLHLAQDLIPGPHSFYYVLFKGKCCLVWVDV